MKQPWLDSMVNNWRWPGNNYKQNVNKMINIIMDYLDLDQHPFRWFGTKQQPSHKKDWIPTNCKLVRMQTKINEHIYWLYWITIFHLSNVNPIRISSGFRVETGGPVRSSVNAYMVNHTDDYRYVLCVDRTKRVWRRHARGNHYSIYLWPFLLTCFIGIKTQMTNYIHSFVFDVITHPCPDFNGGLTHCGLVTREAWVNIGSGNGLLPDGTKPLPEPMLTGHHWSPVASILGQFHNRCFCHQPLTFENYISKISFKFPRGPMS